MTDRKHRRSSRVSARVTSAMVLAALAMSSAAPAAYAGTGLAVSDTSQETEEDSGAKLSVKQTESEAETEAPKKSYSQLETTNSSDAAITAIDVSGIVEECMPSIVTISEKSVQEVQDYFGQTQSVEEEGAASGFIIAQNDDELLIATNNHVVKNATDVTVAFSVDTENEDDRVVAAKVKGTDPGTDLAVVAVQLSDIPEDVFGQLKIAVLGSSDDLKVGQTAITIGNTLGEGLTVTSGIISALNCTVETSEGTWTEFQTDGAANEGQSGGAVLNAKGEVIGIFNAGYLDADNVGYAVPISTAIPVLQDLINRKTRDALDDYGYLGITVAPVSEEASLMYNIPQGAYVYSVEDGSAAQDAGIEKGDVITKFDGLTIDSRDTLLRQIQYYAPGEEVDITLMRHEGGSYTEKTVTVTLGEATDEVKAARAAQNSGSSPDPSGSSDGSGEDSDDGNVIIVPGGGSSDGSDGSTIPWDRIFGDGDGQDSEEQGSGNGSGNSEGDF